ncbi:hypothetical protein Trydic_g20972 [Trypoxylus dichotomus]
MHISWNEAKCTDLDASDAYSTVQISEPTLARGPYTRCDMQAVVQLCAETLNLVQFMHPGVPHEALDFAVVEQDFYECLGHIIGVFRETGSVTHKKGAGRPTVRIEELIIDVRYRMEQDSAKPLKRLFPRRTLLNMPNLCKEEFGYASI